MGRKPKQKTKKIRVTKALLDRSFAVANVLMIDEKTPRARDLSDLFPTANAVGRVYPIRMLDSCARGPRTKDAAAGGAAVDGHSPMSEADALKFIGNLARALSGTRPIAERYQSIAIFRAHGGYTVTIPTPNATLGEAPLRRVWFSGEITADVIARIVSCLPITRFVQAANLAISIDRQLRTSKCAIIRYEVA